jgi:hypothetical protein
LSRLSLASTHGLRSSHTTMNTTTNTTINSGSPPDSEDTAPSRLRAFWNKLKRTRKNKKGQGAQDTSQEATSTQNILVSVSK